MKKLWDEKKPLMITGILVGLIILIFIIFILMKGCVPEYVITFDTDGGTVLNSLKLKKDGTIEKPKDPQKDGYIFVGWFLDGKEFDFNTKIKENITLEARWVKESDKDVKKISIEPETLTMAIGKKAKLEVIYEPADALNKEVTWTSSDESILTVDSKGNITALKEGKATITVTTKDGQINATCVVTIEKEVIAVTDVSINGPSTVNVGETIKLTATITPSNATNQSVSYQSSNTSIATVDKSGNVKGIKAGTVTITVTTSDGKKTATYKVTIKEKSTQNPPSNPSTPTNPSEPTKPEEEQKPTNIPVNNVSIDGGNREMKVGDTTKLKVTITPSDATNQTVTWKTSNNNIVEIDESGNVKAKGIGKATITALVDGKTATIEINVVSSVIEVDSVTVNPNKVTLTVGETKKVTASITPNNATNQTITWKSENTSIVTVDADGTIHGIAKGTTKVTATVGGKSASVDVTVNEKESKYTATLVEQKGLTGSFYYKAIIYKDGTLFEDYARIKIGEVDIRKGKDISASLTNNKTLKNFTIILNDGSTKEVTITEYKVEQIEG